MLTLLDCKQSSIVNIAGKCANSYEFAQLINDATRRLMRRGDWVGTVTPIQVCVRRGCIVFPRYVGTIRKVNLCNRQLPVGNLWYQFIDQREWSCGSWKSCMQGEAVLMANGQAPAYSDIYGDGRLVRAYPRCMEDAGKTLRIFGVDTNNQPLRTNNGDGTWSDGAVITLGVPFGSSTMFYRRIDRVVKDVTQCPVLLYAYDVTNDILEDLAVYDPGETSPSYARWQLRLGNSCGAGFGSTCCGSLHSIVALVKLQFIPAKYDSDLVLIDNLDALKDMVQSIRDREAGDLESALQFEASAVRELNRQLEDTFSDDTFSAVDNVFGGSSFTNHCF